MIIRIWSFNSLNLNFNVKNTQPIFFDLFIKRNKFKPVFSFIKWLYIIIKWLTIVLFYEKLCKIIYYGVFNCLYL
jgi:hypothetical protein